MRAVILTLFFSAILVAAYCAPTQTPADAATTAAAAQAYADHQWSVAEQAYTELTTQDPTNARFWYRLAVAARANQHYERAMTAFTKAKALGAGKGLPHSLADYEIAETYAAKGDAASAFGSLKASADAGFAQVNRLHDDAPWNPFRDDPHFTALLKQVQHNASPCQDDPAYHQFDFWLGDWDVTGSAGGPQQGTSHIAREMDGCVLWENWTSAFGGGFGKSYNTYNQNLKRWEQYWVDSTGGTIFFYGHLTNGVMDYWTDDIPQPNGSMLRRHLQFFQLSSDQVRQFSQGSTDGGKTWTTEYDFLYTRHPAATAAVPQS